MEDNISQIEYGQLCDDFPFFKKIGHVGFGVKVWLIFRALNFGSVSIDSVASNPCQSLMQNNIAFNQIQRFLTELSEVKILTVNGDKYKLYPEHAYELHRICFHLGEKINKKKTRLIELIKECGYTYDERNKTLIANFNNSDVNAKTDTLKDLLSQLAFAGARLLVKIIDKTTDRVE